MRGRAVDTEGVLSLLLNIPVVGPVLMIVLLAAVLAWSGLIGGGSAPSADEIRAAEQARCDAVAGSERPTGC